MEKSLILVCLCFYPSLPSSFNIFMNDFLEVGLYCYKLPKTLTVWITRNCGKFGKEMGIPDHLTCLLGNLYAGQKATLRTDMGQQTDSK